MFCCKMKNTICFSFLQQKAVPNCRILPARRRLQELRWHIFHIRLRAPIYGSVQLNRVSHVPGINMGSNNSFEYGHHCQKEYAF